jgi:hypothetical protein
VAVSLNFTFGTPCGGGNHVPVTASLTGAIVRSKTVTINRDVLLNLPASDDDIQATVEVLLRILIFQVSPKTNGNIKVKIEATTINLTPVP